MSKHRVQRVVAAVVAANVTLEVIRQRFCLVVLGGFSFLRNTLQFARILQRSVFDLLEATSHRRQLVLKIFVADLEGVKVNREFDVLQHLRVDGLLAFVLEPHEVDCEVGRQATDE